MKKKEMLSKLEEALDGIDAEGDDIFEQICYVANMYRMSLERAENVAGTWGTLYSTVNALANIVEKQKEKLKAVPTNTVPKNKLIEIIKAQIGCSQIMASKCADAIIDASNASLDDADPEPKKGQVWIDRDGEEAEILQATRDEVLLDARDSWSIKDFLDQFSFLRDESIQKALGRVPSKKE